MNLRRSAKMQLNTRRMFSFVVMGCVVFGEEAKSDRFPKIESLEERTSARASRIILPKVELHDVTLAQALEFLAEESVIHDQAKVGVEIEVDAAVAKPLLWWRELPGADAGTVQLEMKLTLSLTNVRIEEALEEVVRPVRCLKRPTATGYRVVQYRQEPIRTGTYLLPSQIFGETADPALFGVEPSSVASMRTNLRQYLEDCGVHFAREGTSCSFDLDNLILKVALPIEQLDLVASIMEHLIPGAVPGPEVPKCIDPTKPVRSWTESVTLGAVSIMDLPVLEAVAVINRELPEAGSANADVWYYRRLSIESAWAPGVFRIPRLESLPEEQPESEQWYAGKRVRYSARNVSLLEAATVVAKAAGGQLRFGENYVTIAPPTKTVLVPREYLISPRGEEWGTEPKSEEQKAMMQLLLRGDEPYSPSEPSTYSTRMASFGLRHSLKKHEEVARFIETDWQEYYASDRWKKEQRRQERLRQIQWPARL